MDSGQYKAVVFLVDNDPVAYGLYREEEEEVYLRQFLVRKTEENGIGRQTMTFPGSAIWPRKKRFTVEVLCRNTTGILF